MSELRISYNVIGNGFKLGAESFWIDPKDHFEEDMDERDIREIINELVDIDFDKKHYPEMIRLESAVTYVKEYLQGENNELA